MLTVSKIKGPVCTDLQVRDKQDAPILIAVEGEVHSIRGKIGKEIVIFMTHDQTIQANLTVRVTYHHSRSSVSSAYQLSYAAAVVTIDRSLGRDEIANSIEVEVSLTQFPDVIVERYKIRIETD